VRVLTNPEVNSCHLKRLSISYVVTRSRPYLALALSLALSAGLSFLNITRFEADLGAVDFAIDLVITIDESDILGLGAALERTGAAAQFEVFDEDDGIAVSQNRTVGVLDDARAVGGQSALP
jgi:hypothetical protein